jgi:hypothetical protein
VTQNELDYLGAPKLTPFRSVSLPLHKPTLGDRNDGSFSQASPKRSNLEATFEQLLESHEAAALLKIHPENPAADGSQPGDRWSTGRTALAIPCVRFE